MKIKRIMSFLLVLFTAISIQAAAINVDALNEWSAAKKMDKSASRNDCKKLLEKVIGKAISKTELTTRPNEYITKEEMALMLVNILGYEEAAKKLNTSSKPFNDVQKNIGAIAVVKDLGLISGDSANNFNPKKPVTNGQVLTIVKGLADRLNKPISEVHSSYAIKSSDQMDVIKNLNEVSFGWSQVEYDAENKNINVNTTSNHQNEFNMPVGFEEPLNLAAADNVQSYLMVYLNDRSIDLTGQGKSMTLAAYIFSSKEQREKLIEGIVKALKIPNENGAAEFNGVTIDFENFYNASLKTGFNTFLKELKAELDKEGKKLNVAVQPGEYYKGYDYKEIGRIADRIILMAHDYAAKSLSDQEMQAGLTVTPITPIDEIYKALKQITNPNTGADPSKVMLQISFASTQWQVKDNKIINQRPYTPSYDKIYARLQNPGTKVTYSDVYQNPYAIYVDGGVKNVIWYENTQSVEAKIDLAKLFGVNKISLWRLGTIPNYANNEKGTIDLDILDKLSLAQ